MKWSAVMFEKRAVNVCPLRIFDVTVVKHMGLDSIG